MKKVLFFFSFIAIFIMSSAQEQKMSYRAKVQKRAEKIVSTLNISDSDKFYKVTNMVLDQYVMLNEVYEWRDSSYKALKDSNSSDKAILYQKMVNIDSLTKIKISNLHNHYIRDLSNDLTEDQVDKIKNGMTYNVAVITKKAYQEMIPTLTDVQKDQIWRWLLEARENAMDAESSEKKHAWFGKYKGRINNYLSAQGYDTQKERLQWEDRIKAKHSK